MKNSDNCVMQGLAKAYYIWKSPTKAEIAEKKKHIEYVHTRDGREMPIDEWEQKCLEMITQADLSDLLKQIEEYVQHNCLWVKTGELRSYSMDCLIKGSYRHWSDFNYQFSIAAQL